MFDNDSGWRAGNKYVGVFKDGEIHEGMYNWAKGTTCVGGWKNRRLHGNATCTYANGTKYVGPFKDGKRYGQGTLYFLADDKFKGDKYVGEFNGGFHGHGVYTKANGAEYVGGFQNDKQHGQGTFTFADGRVLKGVWKNGVAPRMPSTAEQNFIAALAKNRTDVSEFIDFDALAKIHEKETELQNDKTEARLKGKYIEISGKVSEVVQKGEKYGFRKYHIQLRDGNSYIAKLFASAVCYAKKGSPEVDLIEGMYVGDLYRIGGKVLSYGDMTGLQMNNCSVLY